MPNWPTNPEWIDLLNINKGNEYVAADGVTVTDMNSIINDLLYLKAHSSGGGGSTNIQGENFTCRVAPGENIEAGSFVGVTGTYGDGIFAGVKVNSIELCRSGDNVYVFFYDTTNQTNKVVCLSIDNETNQVIVSPQVNLGKITSEYAVAALSENIFIMCYASNTSILARYMTIDFENGIATIQDPIVAASSALSKTLRQPRIILGADTKLYIFTTYASESGKEHWCIYSFDTTTRQSSLLYASPYYNRLYTTSLVRDVQPINENTYAVAFFGSATIVQLYGNSASVYSPVSLTDLSYSLGIVSNNLFILTRQHSGGFSADLCRINDNYSITKLQTQITGTSTNNANPAVIVVNSTTAYVLYTAFDGLYYLKMDIQGEGFTYQTNKVAAFEASQQLNTGRCISLKENSFLWFYGDSAGRFTQRDENFIPTDNDVLGNIYVTKRLINSNQYIGIATTGAQSNQLINVTVPYRSYAIQVQTSNCTYTANAYVIRKDETVTLSFKTKDASYKFSSTVTVRNAKYVWNSATGELTISEAKNTVYIVVTAEFTGIYTYSTDVTPSTNTTLTSSVNCNVGDLIIAAFAIRSDLVSLSDGWTLISTSKDKLGTVNQTLSWAQKVAESTTESITVTQTSSALIYINLIALPGATSVIDNGYTAQTTQVKEITVSRPSGLVLFGLTANIWSLNSPFGVWTSSVEDMPIIQPGETKQGRLGIALDQTAESTVSFYPGFSGGSPMIVGSLTVQGMTKFY